MSFTDFTAGPETLVNTTTVSDQLYPSVAALSGGGYIVTWTSYNQADSSYDIFGQMFDASGHAVGGETQLNTTSASDQMSSTVAALSNGGYVVTWMSDGQDGDGWGIYGQRFDASGHAVGGETQINTTTATDQVNPTVAALGNGGYVVTWASYDQATSAYDIYGQTFDASGNAVGGETLVNSTAASDNPHVAGLSDGGYVVTWSAHNPATSEDDIHEQRFDASGAAVGGETTVNTTTTSDESSPSVAALAGGGYIVTWASFNPTTSEYDILGQRYDASGAAVGGETRINTTTTDASLADPSVSALSDGGYMVTWSALGQDGSGWGVYGQRFDASGHAVGGETLINTTTASDQTLPAVAGLSGGGDVITWMSSGQDGSGWGIYDKVYSPDPASSTPTVVLPPVAVADTASATEAGRVHTGTPGVNPTGNVLANDSDPAGNALTVSGVSHGASSGAVGTALAGDHGTLTLNADGSYSYVVNNSDSAVEALTSASDTLTDTFNYTVLNSAGASSSTTLTVTIHGANAAPVALPDQNVVAKGASLSVGQSTGVLANDYDNNPADHLTVSQVDGSANGVGHAVAGAYGSLTLNADGSYTYVANSTASGSGSLQDVFTYQVSDGHGGFATSTLTISVTSKGAVCVQAAPHGSDTPGSNHVGDNDIINELSSHGSAAQFVQSIFSNYASQMCHAAQASSEAAFTMGAADTNALQHASWGSLSSWDFPFG